MNTNTGPRSHETRERKPYYGKRPASLYEVTGRIEDVNTLLVAIHDWPELRNQYLPSIQVLVRGFEINIQRGKGGFVNLVARAHQQHASLWGRIRQNLANALFRAGDLCNLGNHNGPVQVVEGAMADIAKVEESCGRAPTSMNDRVVGQALQPSGVGLPGLGAGSGQATVAVEVYALGTGVSIPGQERDLPGTEGALELEAYRVRLVIDPLRARKSDWFVAPIEGDVTAVFESVQAVDQEQLAELGFRFSHGASPVAKTAILSLPQGMGKTIFAQQIAQFLGCTHVIDEWHPSLPVLPGALHLTNVDVPTEGATA